MTETTQAAVDAAKTEAAPSVPANNAQTGDDLDSLLKQFDTETKTAPPPPQAKVEQQPTPQVDDGRIRRIEERFFQEDLDRAVSQIFSDAKVSPRVAKGWLDQIAREKPEIANRFLNQHANPEGWNSLIPGLQKQAKQDFNLDIDKSTTEDVAAVAAAVRGASTKAPAEQAPDYSRMNNADLRKEFQDKYGFSPPF